MNAFLTNQDLTAVQFTSRASAAARERMVSRRGEPMFAAAWRRVLMMHFEVDARALQRTVPFSLDLHEGRAFVSLVAFSMEGMRPRLGGKLATLAFRPIATHEFLNVRTYVNCNGEPGIHFLAEWLNNRLAVTLGPGVFGLPYRYGKIVYEFNLPAGCLRGHVANAADYETLGFHGNLLEPARFHPAEVDSLTEWLMERYMAYNSAGGRRRFFRVWHPPWPQCAAEIQIDDLRLLTRHWPWFAEARFVGANFSQGFDEVWMGRPHRDKIRVYPATHCGHKVGNQFRGLLSKCADSRHDLEHIRIRLFELQPQIGYFQSSFHISTSAIGETNL